MIDIKLRKINYNYDKLKKEFDEYIDLLQKSLDPTNSIAWQNKRTRSFGGSEVATYRGIKAFEDMTVPVLISKKIGLYDTSIPQFRQHFMDWGHVFEDVGVSYIEKIWKCKIEEVGQIPSLYYQSFTPDGLGIVELYNITKNKEHRGIFIFMIFEFKSPFSRIPDGKIPKYYLPQVKMGTSVITQSNLASYIECVFRKCLYTDLDFSNLEYDKVYHSGDEKKNIKFTQVYAYGVIFLYLKDKNRIGLDYNDYHNKLKKLAETDTYEDFGNVDFKFYNYLMSGIVNKFRKFISIEYSDLAYTDDICYDDTITMFRKKCKKNGYNFIGIIPFKMFDIKINFIQKDESYILENRNKRIKLMNIINDIYQSDDRGKKYLDYMKYLY